MPTVRFQNPNVLDVPEVADLFTKAFAKSPYPPFDHIKHLIRARFGDPTVAVIALSEAGTWKGLTITMLPQGLLETKPQVIHMYNEGSLHGKASIIKATMDFVLESGYTSFQAINLTGKGDNVWKRAMGAEGWDITKVGSVMEFKVK